MRTPRRSLIPAALIAALASTAGPGAYAQGTPNGETPANEGVCDELLGGTPGLYGLCVGFCEAQDCEATLDEATGEVTFDADCNPSAPMLLANYETRASASDPAMPCLNVVTGECPCWTEVELDGLASDSQRCSDVPISTMLTSRCDPGPPCYAFLDLAVVQFGSFCRFRSRDPEGAGCASTNRQLLITPDEYMVCLDSIRDECTERGIPLP